MIFTETSSCAKRKISEYDSVLNFRKRPFNGEKCGHSEPKRQKKCESLISPSTFQSAVNKLSRTFINSTQEINHNLVYSAPPNYFIETEDDFISMFEKLTLNKCQIDYDEKLSSILAQFLRKYPNFLSPQTTALLSGKENQVYSVYGWNNELVRTGVITSDHEAELMRTIFHNLHGVKSIFPSLVEPLRFIPDDLRNYQYFLVKFPIDKGSGSHCIALWRQDDHLVFYEPLLREVTQGLIDAIRTIVINVMGNFLGLPNRIGIFGTQRARETSCIMRSLLYILSEPLIHSVVP